MDKESSSGCGEAPPAVKNGDVAAEKLAPQNVPGGISNALASIDKQMPNLTYHGLTCWLCWNTIAFSGSFWMHETENGLVTESLVVGHLIACMVTLLFFSLFSQQTKDLVAKNWFTFLGACAAFAGTLLVSLANNASASAKVLFFLGTFLTGSGTTFLFVRAAPLFCSLPPRRAIFRLACCSITGGAIYFMLDSCGDTAGTVGFALLPLASALLFSLRSKNKFGEAEVLHTETHYFPKFALFLASVVLCSMAVEVATSSILLAEIPTHSTNSTVIAQLMGVGVMAVIVVVTLLLRDRYSYGKCYSISAFLLAALLMGTAILPIRTTATAALASCIRNTFNMTIWAMLAYIVFQSRAGAVRTFCLGNAALSLGALLGGLFTMANYTYGLVDDDSMRILMALLGVAVLVDLVFVFSEKQINELLKPIEKERLTQDVIGEQEKRPKQWVLTCQAIAESCGLSKRESEVFAELARGRTAQEIADKETVSVYTIRAHTRSIYAKLDVHSKKELAQFIEERVSSE